MAGRIAVDHDALTAASRELDAMAAAVEGRRGALLGALAGAESHLAGSATGRLLSDLTDAVVDVHGDLATALGGLAQGLESVVATFTEIDVVSAAEARAWRVGLAR